MRSLTLRLILPVLILLALELAFRAGVWERLTPKNSHIGKSARVTRALNAWSENIDFVTIGDSRAKHGLDHEMIAGAAKSRGFTHARLTIPGGNFLTETLLIKYLESEHPALRGGVFALSISSLLYPTGGDTELAIAQPLSSVFKREKILLDRFDTNRPASWGAVSSLYQYREYIQDFVQDPKARLEALRNENYSDEWQLFASVPTVRDVCKVDWTDLASCAAYSGNNRRDARVADLCGRWLPNTEPKPDVHQRFVRDPLGPYEENILDLRQEQFRSLNWPKPPLVVLMPISHLWYEKLAPEGADAWAHRVLDPLVKEGKIQLLDYTHFFGTETDSRCEAFSDPYHQSELGMQEMTADLLPKIEAWLYDSDSSQ
jgi:hypothetical protein